MARIRYIPEEGTPPVASQFGITFGPEPVEVTDPRIIAKCKGSPFYEVMSADPSQDSGDAIELRAVHKGRGKYVILDGDNEVMADLDKASADNFNALSDDLKLAYVTQPE